MDDNAQTPPISTPVTPTAPVAQVAPVQPQQVPPLAPSAQPTQGLPVPSEQPTTRLVVPPMPGRSPEQGPATGSLPSREAAPIDEADAVPSAVSDDQSDTPDAGTDAKDAMPQEAAQLQESHPTVEISKELQEVGVQQGKDVAKENLPEEQLAVPTTPASTVSAQQKTDLPMPYADAIVTSKKSKIKDSVRWLARLVKRQWEIKQSVTATEEVKKSEEAVASPTEK